jgi:hypothetical protein
MPRLLHAAIQKGEQLLICTPLKLQCIRSALLITESYLGRIFCMTFGSLLVGDIDLSKQVNSWSIRGILVKSRFLGDAVPCLLLLANNMADYLLGAFINALAAPIRTAVTVTHSDALNALIVPIQSVLREIREVRDRVKNWTSRLPRSSYLTRRGSARVQSFVQLSFVCLK